MIYGRSYNMPRAGKWPGVDPGDLRHQLTFLKQTIGTDGTGANIGWFPTNPPVTAAASMEVLRGDEVIKAGLDISQLYAIFIIRYQDGIVASARFQTEAGSVWIIQAIEDIEDRGVLLRITALGLADNR